MTAPAETLNPAEVLAVLQQQASIMAEMVELNRAIRKDVERHRIATEALLKVASVPLHDEVDEIVRRRQLSLQETLSTIRDNNLSLARFGDGEFLMIQRLEYHIRFQRNSPALQKALLDSLHAAAAAPDKVLVGFPHIFSNIHWTGMYADAWRMLKEVAQRFDRLGDSHVSRPLAFESLGNQAVTAWRSIWEGRNVLIVTGKGSRFDMTPALFDNLAGHEFLYSQPTNAFADVPRLIDEVKDRRPEQVLISLGPAGSILAVALALEGIQTLDIGHISSSYQNVMEGGLFPEDAPAINLPG